MQLHHDRLRSQRGSVLALVALLAVVLLGFAALAIDSSHVEGAAQQLQELQTRGLGRQQVSGSRGSTSDTSRRSL